jgi:tetratricopeptide (TPR) repeat protein
MIEHSNKTLSASMNMKLGSLKRTALSFPRSLALLGLAALVLTTTALPAQKKSKDSGSDRITTQKGKVLRKLEILKEGFTEVTYKKSGKEQKIRTDQVIKIEWGNLPESYQRAGVAAEKGDWEKAASLYQDAANSSSRAAFSAAAGFLALDALLKTSSGDATKAGSAATNAQNWLDKNADHGKTPETMAMLGKLWLLAAKPEEALAAFKKLEEAVNTKNLPTTWLARARYGQAMALTDEGKFEKARQAFGSAAATLRGQDLSKDPAAAAIFIAAEVGKGETLMAEGKFDSALQNFQQITMVAGSNEALKTAAICGQAAALVEIAVAGKDHKKLRNAQDQLARVSATDLLDGDSSAKALYYLGKVVKALGKDEPDSARRSKRYFESVIQGYPDSSWALIAQRALK